jgi:transcriptional regulator of acetoin/glycerol metabolism
MEACGWNKKKASLSLGISRSTLYEKLRKYDIKPATKH